MNKKVITITATVALLVGGAGYFTGSAVESQASAVAVKQMQDERIIEVSKVQGQKKVAVDEVTAAAEAQKQLCIQYKDQADVVIKSLTDVLEASTDMIGNDGDFGITIAYSQAADEFVGFVGEKADLDGLATQCTGVSADTEES